jgi:DNA-binding transcriptional LysR family regulator
VRAREWLAAREADLLPVGYFHVVFSIPVELADIALYNKTQVYDLLFRTAAETTTGVGQQSAELGQRSYIIQRGAIGHDLHHRGDGRAQGSDLHRTKQRPQPQRTLSSVAGVLSIASSGAGLGSIPRYQPRAESGPRSRPAT